MDITWYKILATPRLRAQLPSVRLILLVHRPPEIIRGTRERITRAIRLRETTSRAYG